MRQLISILSMLAIAGTTSAHTLSEEAGTLSQLAHQLLGSHHLPFVLLLLVIGLLVVRAIGAKRPD